MKSGRRSIDTNATHKSLPKNLTNGNVCIDRPMVYVINLKRRKDRNVRVQKLNWGLPLHMIEAIDAKNITWGSLAVQNLVGKRVRALSLKAEENRVPTVDRAENTLSNHLTLGAVACAMSHRSVWSQVAKQKAWAIVVEDDVSNLAPNFGLRATSAVKNLGSEWGLAYLGYHASNGQVAATDVPLSLREYTDRDGLITGLFAYAVSPHGASFLLKKTRRLSHQIDVMIGEIDWKTVPKNVMCYVPQKGKRTIPMLAMAPESKDSDVQTYEGGKYTHHSRAPDEFDIR